MFCCSYPFFPPPFSLLPSEMVPKDHPCGQLLNHLNLPKGPWSLFSFSQLLLFLIGGLIVVQSSQCRLCRWDFSLSHVPCTSSLPSLQLSSDFWGYKTIHRRWWSHELPKGNTLWEWVVCFKVKNQGRLPRSRDSLVIANDILIHSPLIY